jgi:hypothetical protein
VKTRTTAIILTLFLVAYFVLIGQRAVWLLESGGAVGIGLGIGAFLLPLVGVWIAVVNLRFGVRVERLARRLAEEGQLPDTSELPRRPSGRIERPAADAWFDQCKADLDDKPEDWRRWYRLAHAYDIAGDRRRARETMRHALQLADADPVRTA